MMNKTRSQSTPIPEDLNFIKETKFCINTSRQFKEEEAKQKFLNKLSFDYSLQKINKEKIYGRLIATASQMYPKVVCEGGRYTAQQYSARRIRQKRRSYIMHRLETKEEEHRESIKKYSHILNKKKQKQGGLDSFWLFRRDKRDTKSREKQQNKKTDQAEERKMEQQHPNKVELAFSKILAWGKLPIDLANGLISKSLLKNYLSFLISEPFSEWFVSFFQIRSYINFKEFEAIGEKFKTMDVRYSHLVSFFLYDCNGDGFIEPKDVFAIFSKEIDKSIEEDILLITAFTKNNEREEDELTDKFKAEQVVIRDEWLTCKDYEAYFKKVDEPFLLATNKKDTGFSKTFAVLDHRQKVRSTRRELNHKKMMYNQLFGKLASERLNRAFVAPQDYKLNYSLFHEIFHGKYTQLFSVFCLRLLGVKPKSE